MWSRPPLAAVGGGSRMGGVTEDRVRIHRRCCRVTAGEGGRGRETSVSDELYDDLILDHYESPYHRGHLECPSCEHTELKSAVWGPGPVAVADR